MCCAREIERYGVTPRGWLGRDRVVFLSLTVRMDINNLAGAADYTEGEMSASPIDPTLVGTSKGKRKADDDEGEADGTGKKRRNRKVRPPTVRPRS